MNRAMDLPDVNVLVDAFRRDSARHERARAYLESLANGHDRFALSTLVLSGFLRVATLRIGGSPTVDKSLALAFVEALLSSPVAVAIVPGSRHLRTFLDFVRLDSVRGNAVPDAYHAALAIESGCEFVTSDRGFGRFPGLRWRLLD